QIDHVHAQFGSMPATVGMLLAEIPGLTFRLSLHARDIFTDESIILPTKLMEAEFATVCTQAGMNKLLATQPAAVHSRIHLVRHGIALGAFTTGTRRPTREPIIAIIGRLVEKKGHQVLLRAAEVLRRSRGRFTIAIAGDGPLQPELEAVRDSLGLAHAVTFCGSLAREEIKELLQAARCLVVPSIVASDGDRDGLPNVILEAAAVGTPIVGSHVAGIPEFIEHRDTGLIVEPNNPRELGEAIKAILDDPAGASAMGERARAKVIKEYDASRNVLALEAFFRETIARTARGDVPPETPEREGLTTSE
ncbi:MAG TPA: glycosyltransferase family 4 protein, partial [Armatimonadota bacterium]|nr:glycosyltransferase family 4 protein [Armatimonadota bacterium]